MICETKWNAMRSKLCWTHYREVLSLKNINAIIYYLSECENKNLTQRQLHELIKHNSYNVFSNEKVSTLWTLLTWSHYSELLSIKDINKLMYYINIAINNNFLKKRTSRNN